MLILQNITHNHPNGEVLFSSIHLTLNKHDKVSLVGNNGVGKSTLLNIIAQNIQPLSGSIHYDVSPYYVPQIFGQYHTQTVAQALNIDNQLTALQAILNGEVTEQNLQLLNEDWLIEERAKEALRDWLLPEIELTQPMNSLSGGQQTKVLLAGLSLHQPQLVLLDEPTNHLDVEGRNRLYEYIQSTYTTLVVVSHDRKLLQLLPTTLELNATGIVTYGGNYDFYAEQKEIEKNALNQHIQGSETMLRKARLKERETLERQQKLNARGKKKHEKEGVARIMLNTMRNNAENSTSKLQHIHSSKITDLTNELNTLRSQVSDIDRMKFGFSDPTLHKEKMLIEANSITFSYPNNTLWKSGKSFTIKQGERIALKGANGSGKTTLIQLLLGNLKPTTGAIQRASFQAIYVNQQYSLLDLKLSVYEQAIKYNTHALEEHQIKIRLHRFLFTKDDWDTSCNVLSGGERMRLLLCCMTLMGNAPDMIVLDEPTNNLDIQNTEILTAAINKYQGTLIVVSHDEVFLKQLAIERELIV